LAVYFANDREPNVDGGHGRPSVQAPKPNVDVAETHKCLVDHDDTVDGVHHALDGASDREHTHHDATLPAPNSNQL